MEGWRGDTNGHGIDFGCGNLALRIWNPANQETGKCFRICVFRRILFSLCIYHCFGTHDVKKKARSFGTGFLFQRISIYNGNDERGEAAHGSLKD